MTGRVKWFSDAKGYGFVVTDDLPDQDIFVHFSAIQGEGFRTLVEGQPVDFGLGQGPKGVFAENVVKTGEPPVVDETEQPADFRGRRERHPAYAQELSAAA